LQSAIAFFPSFAANGRYKQTCRHNGRLKLFGGNENNSNMYGDFEFKIYSDV